MASDNFTSKQLVDILLEEYRVLNQLLLFRLQALDRRLPVTAGVIVATIASIEALPKSGQLVLLWVIPLSVQWLVRSTAQHARSKEDHLRRIDELERLVNQLAKRKLLVFQSVHPNLRKPSGRSGQNSLVTVFAFGVTLLAACLHLFARSNATGWLIVYATYVGLITVDSLRCLRQVHTYRYRKPSPTPPDLMSPSNISHS